MIALLNTIVNCIQIIQGIVKKDTWWYKHLKECFKNAEILSSQHISDI